MFSGALDGPGLDHLTAPHLQTLPCTLKQGMHWAKKANCVHRHRGPCRRRLGSSLHQAPGNPSSALDHHPPLTPDILGVAPLRHQLLHIIHSLLVTHFPVLCHNLVEGVLHIPGHVACITGRRETRMQA